jgi:hypothetical protein
MPKRPSTYLMILLLLALVAMVWWLNDLLGNAEKKAPAPSLPVESSAYSPPPELSDEGKQSGVYHGTLPTTKPQVDETNLQLADQLNAPDRSAAQDLDVLASFMDLYTRAFKSGNPVGENMDITAAITGTANPNKPGRLFPPKHNAIRKGQLVDRWGSPFWFHPETAFKMEIRSAGPDRSLFTEDDIIRQP